MFRCVFLSSVSHQISQTISVMFYLRPIRQPGLRGTHVAVISRERSPGHDSQLAWVNPTLVALIRLQGCQNVVWTVDIRFEYETLLFQTNLQSVVDDVPLIKFNILFCKYFFLNQTPPPPPKKKKKKKNPTNTHTHKNLKQQQQQNKSKKKKPHPLHKNKQTKNQLKCGFGNIIV